MAFQSHPAANIFPLLEGAEFDRLCEDIRANGIKVPIIIHPDLSILDGRNRFRACEAVGVKPVTALWAGKPGQEIDYVVSLNLSRRHLNPSQLGMIAARIADMRHGGDTKGPRGPLLAEAVKQVSGATERTAKRAHVVQTEGTPEQVAAVDRGEVSVTAVVREIRGEKPKTKPREITDSMAATIEEVSALRAEVENLKEWGQENAQSAKDLLAEAEVMQKIFDADDKLKTAVAEIKRLTGINAILSSRIDGLQNETNELKGIIRSRDARIKKLLAAAEGAKGTK